MLMIVLFYINNDHHHLVLKAGTKYFNSLSNYHQLTFP